MQKKVTLSINSKTYSEFHKYCDDNAIMLSKKIEIFIKDFLESENKTDKYKKEGRK